MEWTNEQKSAINIRSEKSILLSAAAGSGKTSVLVERIIGRLKDKENPLSVTSLLSLTFTEAAAAQMKRKISRALRDELEKEPENEYLRRQAALLPSAQISTVHSFLNKLIKGNIHLTGLPAEFTLCSEAESELLLKQAFDKAFEKYYQRIDRLGAFKELTESYGGAKGDTRLREAAKNLYLFTRSLPYPSEWLNMSVSAYKTYYLEENVKNTPWQVIKETETKALTEQIKRLNEKFLYILASLPESHKYQGFYRAEAEITGEALKNFEDGDPSAVLNFKFPAKVRKQNSHPAEEAAADGIRELVKINFTKLAALISSETDESLKLLKNLYLRAKTLKNIILLTDRIYKKLKISRSLLDFSDLEHEALKLLSDKDKKPTAAAMELKKKYAEIFLDEYQDTSGIQDEIFRLISRNSDNIFMVGDLKQSIYKFRSALPELFAEKRRIYKNNPEYGNLLSLNKNFRSRKGVIETVNFIFSRIMSEKLGGVSYNSEEFLTEGAHYPETLESTDNSDYDTEFFIIKNGENESVSEEDLKRAEIKIIINRIKTLAKNEFMVYNRDEDDLKSINFSDIVILLRNRTMYPMFEEEFAKEGIPVVTDKGGGCLSSFEVQTVLSILNIIDNPLKCIPLIAVLRSDIFGFTPDELAEIRLCDKKGYFYDALLASAAKGNKKSADFICELDYLRQEASKCGIYRLIMTIYDRYNLFSLFGAMSFPEIRLGNLKMLMQAAADFEKTEARGLFAFMNYLKKVEDEGNDIVSFKGSAKSENAVRIMTVHNSKGLEFPVVFLSDTSHKFNLSDASLDINFHHSTGLSLAAVDAEERVKYPSLPSALLSAAKSHEMLSEEMRLLYVALTRAKEKLIITFRQSSKKRMESWLFDENKRPYTAQLTDAPCPGDWIFSALLTHKNAKGLREAYGYGENILCKDFDFNLKTETVSVCKDNLNSLTAIFFIKGSESNAAYKSFGATSAAENDNVSRCGCNSKIRKFYHKSNDSALPQGEAEQKAAGANQNGFLPAASDILSYRQESLNIPLKVTVSELKRQLAGEEAQIASLDSLRSIHLNSLGEKSELTAAQKGTVNHFFLQHLDEKSINCEEDLLLALDKAVEKGIISEAQKACVNIKGLLSFFKSELGIRLKKSPKVYKEYSFYAPAFNEQGENTLMQGTIDCFFEEDDEIILIDYKTDYVRTKAEALERSKNYKFQLECYNYALKSVFGKEAKEGYICFLSCAESIRIF